ncbi:MAG: phosphate signaling complex protein PhoU [Angelakisella sp.]|nr:phosphate signaling complex protein PhoU [Angelakisella sp.]
MRNRFDNELELLHGELMEMGLLIENAIVSAVEALTNRDAAQAQQAIAFDSNVDEKEKDIERRCLRLLLQQQPVATDLRKISTALKMITDMERIGDQAADISEITLMLPQNSGLSGLEDIPRMAQITIGMVKDSIDAYVRKDLDLANAVIARDDQVDELFAWVRQELIDLIRDKSESGSEAVDMLMVAKYLERIGDHATNIAEWVVFSITGVHKDARII